MVYIITYENFISMSNYQIKDMCAEKRKKFKDIYKIVSALKFPIYSSSNRTDEYIP